MQPRWRKIVTAVLLAVALVLGWQRPSAIACAMDANGCDDHCGIVSVSCAMACPARLEPAPVEYLARCALPELIVFSFDLPILDGLVVTPDTAPPRSAA